MSFVDAAPNGGSTARPRKGFMTVIRCEGYTRPDGTVAVVVIEADRGAIGPGATWSHDGKTGVIGQERGGYAGDHFIAETHGGVFAFVLWVRPPTE